MSSLNAFDSSATIPLDESLKKDIQNAKLNNDLITLPLHIIICHSGDSLGQANNLSLEHIQSQIDVLNEDFQALNSSFDSVPEQFSKSNPNIEFCIATVDKIGKPLEGITRYSTNLNFDDFDLTIKRNTGRDRDEYINVWVTPELENLGYAFVPSTMILPNVELDGIVIRTDAFGGPGYATNDQAILGHTLTHEMGHFLGLKHLWGPREDSFCDEDDGILDTPLQETFNFSCPIHPRISCDNDGDMFMNFMDYTDDECRAAFTEGQVEYMRTILQTSRKKLVETGSNKCMDVDNLPITFFPSLVVDNLCYGDSSGVIELEIWGGVAPYEIYLNGELRDSTNFVNLPNGKHEIKIIDSTNDVRIDSFEISSPPPITFNTIVRDLDHCRADGYASLYVQENGGFGFFGSTVTNLDTGNKYTETWSLFEGLPLGTYEISATDDHGCIGKDTIEISRIPFLEMELLDIIPGNCERDEFESAVHIQGVSGSPPYQYEMMGITNSTGLFEGIPAGSHTAFVIDSLGCKIAEHILVESDYELEIEILEIIPSSCNNNNGLIRAFANANTNVTYSLDRFDNDAGIFGSLDPGYHQIVVKEGLCEITKNVYVPAVFSPSISIARLDSLCPPLFILTPEAQIDIDVNDTSGNTYWYELDDVFSSTIGRFEVTEPGEYKIDISDRMYCDTTIYVEVAPFEIDTFGYFEFEVPCGHDTLAVLPIDISDQYIVTMIEPFYGADIGTENLIVGRYAVRHRTCFFEDGTFRILPEFRIDLDSILINHVQCYGDKNGRIDCQSTTTDSIYFRLGNEESDTGYFDSLAVGQYSLIMYNDAGCIDSVLIHITEPSLLVQNSTIQGDDGTGNGSINVVASGGIHPYTHSIDGINYSLIPTFLNLTHGSYTVYVKDQLECISTEQVEIPSLTSVNEIQANPFHLFNNGNDLFIHSKNNKAQDFKLSIFDLQGKNILRQNCIGCQSKNKIPLSNVPSGIYIVQLQTEEQIFVQKIFL